MSYLFASSTLDADALFRQLDGLLSRLGHGPVTLLYTNTTRRSTTASIQDSARVLRELTFQVYAEDQGEIIISRSTGPAKAPLVLCPIPPPLVA